MIPLIAEHLDAIKNLCARHRVRRLFLFGSAATGKFDPATSDLDFLVVFEADVERGWDGVYFQMKAALEELFGRPVDLVEAHVPRNPYLIESINKTKQLLYAA